VVHRDEGNGRLDRFPTRLLLRSNVLQSYRHTTVDKAACAWISLISCSKPIDPRIPQPPNQRSRQFSSLVPNHRWLLCFNFLPRVHLCPAACLDNTSHGPVQVLRGRRAHADRALLRRRRRWCRSSPGLPVLLLQRGRGRCHVVVLVPVRVRRGGGGREPREQQVEAGAVAAAGRPGHGPEAAGGVVQGVRRGGPRQGLLPQELQVDQGQIPPPRLRMVLIDRHNFSQSCWCCCCCFELPIFSSLSLFDLFARLVLLDFFPDGAVRVHCKIVTKQDSERSGRHTVLE
jgi:hypothetical protein